MSKLVLFPYPRLADSEVHWSDWTVSLDGHNTSADEVADAWDAKSQMFFRISARVGMNALKNIGGGRLSLMVTASCRDTAYTATSTSEFIHDPESANAQGQVMLAGRDVAESVELRAKILLPVEAEASSDSRVLCRRIVAESRAVKVPLNSDLAGFPTTSYSFNDHKIPDAPWRIEVTADELEAPFSQSVRLHLNEDYPLVRELMDGSPRPFVEAELTASITRVLIASVAALADNEMHGRSPDTVAAENPESIAAAAKRATEQYLKKSLNAAVKDLHLQPERLEYAIAGGIGLLKDKR